MAEPSLPNLIVIGAMKSATTSLNHYLGAHPEIYTVRSKELNFFVEEMNWKQGLDWYKSWFITDKPIRGEASPNYTIFPFRRSVPERMHGIIPDARLIYLVRDPIERMMSHYGDARLWAREKRTIDEALTDPNSWYVHRSRYYTQLEQYIPYYDLSRILVISSEELKQDRMGTLRRVFLFLGVDEEYRSPIFDELRHVSRNKRQLTPLGFAMQKAYGAVRPLLPRDRSGGRLVAAAKRALSAKREELPELSVPARERIAEMLSGEVARLRGLTGRDFPEWSI